MVSEVVMPKMGYDMEEGKIVQWIKREGDEVRRGDVIAEIETGKVNIEVEAFDSGVLRRIVVGEGETVPVGETIAWIAGPDEEVPEVPEDGRAAPEEEAPEPEALAEEPVPADVKAEPIEEEFAPVGGVKASPLARRIAEEKGVNITHIEGTGPGGRITRDDVEAYIEALEAERPEEEAPPVPEVEEVRPPKPVEVPVPQRLPEVPAERVELSQLRKTVGRRMVESKTQAPDFYVTMSIDMGAAMELRERVNEYTEEAEGVQVSVNDLIVRATSRVLRDFPRMNASFAGEAVVLYRQINIGVAVATDDGLLTVVVPNADQKSLSQIARETRDKVTRARQGRLRAEDFEIDSTFTVSNLGMYGVDEFVAIINPPQAAIMAVGAVQPTPVVRDGEVTIAQIMRATVSGDHRVVDGADVAEFLGEVKCVLENPMALLA